MTETYKAILSRNQLRWVTEQPDPSKDYEVEVTLVRPSAERAPGNGTRLAALLEEIAAAGGIKSIPDPDAWLREERKDRPLPGRE